MIFSVSKIIAFLSISTTLLPGTVNSRAPSSFSPFQYPFMVGYLFESFLCYHFLSPPCHHSHHFPRHLITQLSLVSHTASHLPPFPLVSCRDSNPLHSSLYIFAYVLVCLASSCSPVMFSSLWCSFWDCSQATSKCLRVHACIWHLYFPSFPFFYIFFALAVSTPQDDCLCLSRNRFLFIRASVLAISCCGYLFSSAIFGIHYFQVLLPESSSDSDIKMLIRVFLKNQFS